MRSIDHATPLYPQKLALTSPTSGGRSVDIVRSRTKVTELVGCLLRKLPKTVVCNTICSVSLATVLYKEPIRSAIYLLNWCCVPCNFQRVWHPWKEEIPLWFSLCSDFDVQEGKNHASSYDPWRPQIFLVVSSLCFAFTEKELQLRRKAGYVEKYCVAVGTAQDVRYHMWYSRCWIFEFR
jgi:hypothetical protein